MSVKNGSQISGLGSKEDHSLRWGTRKISVRAGGVGEGGCCQFWASALEVLVGHPREDAWEAVPCVVQRPGLEPAAGLMGIMVIVEPAGVSESACGECVLGQEKGLEPSVMSPNLGTQMENRTGVKGEGGEEGAEQGKCATLDQRRH